MARLASGCILDFTKMNLQDCYEVVKKYFEIYFIAVNALISFQRSAGEALLKAVIVRL